MHSGVVVGWVFPVGLAVPESMGQEAVFGYLGLAKARGKASAANAQTSAERRIFFPIRPSLCAKRAADQRRTFQWIDGNPILADVRNFDDACVQGSAYLRLGRNMSASVRLHFWAIW